LNARQKRLFEEARKRNPSLQMPQEKQPAGELTDDDLALIKQGVGDKTGRPEGASAPADEAAEPAEQTGSIVTYFEEKGFGFLRPESGGRDVFFHISRVVDSDATALRPGVKVIFELGMDRTGKMAASSVKIATEPPA
jgi:CspA family cold shock protein